MGNKRNSTIRQRLRKRWRMYAWKVLTRWRRNVEARLESAVRLRLYRDDQLSRLVFADDFELPERQFLKAFLRPGDTFVDIGANIGLFTVLAARRVGREGRVFAFEPSARSFERLQANVALNHFENVECHRLALSETGGQLTMRVSADGFDAWNTFGRPTAGKEFLEESVPCVTWDAFAQGRSLVGRVTMMKIDVEGWEARVLSGGVDVLSREDAPVMQIEFSQESALAAGSSCVDLYHKLQVLGYQMYVYDVASGRLVPDPLRERYPYLNLIAAKRLDQVSARLDESRRGFE
jgi:FkbM family methyltransferase